MPVAAVAAGLLPHANAALLAQCPHFGSCGGCVDIAPKQDRLPRALQAAGYDDGAVAPLCVSPPGARRRMDLAMLRVDAGVVLGLHRHRSHEVIDLQVCYVLQAELVALFAPLRAVLGRLDLLRRKGAVIANWCDNGVDLLVRSDAPASRHDRTKLAVFAAAHGIARVSHAVGSGEPETLASLRPPTVVLSGVAVYPPPGAFLQATAAGQAAIVAAVVAGLPALTRRDRVAELYAGIGTLTFAMAAHARVDAFEGDAAAHAALDAACRAAGLAGRVLPIRRDLVRQPLMASELAAYKVVVLDPPAGGAPMQIRQVAQAGTKQVIYVSCDQAALARDAAVLRTAGYSLAAAQPVDQFIGAAQVESVCVFTRDKVQAARRDRQTWKLSPQPQRPFSLGFEKVNPDSSTPDS